VNTTIRIALTVFFIFITGRALYALQGRVVDAASGRGVSEATVVLGGRTVKTDETGHFQIMEQGEQVYVRAPGYRASTYSMATVIANGTLALTAFAPKALYLTVYGIGSRQLRNGALGIIHQGSANALVIDVKGDRGIVPYPSAVPLVKLDSARRITTIPDLAALVRNLHRQGIYTIARIVVFKDDPLAHARPDLAIKRQNGLLYLDAEGLAWTNPFLAEVQNYNIAIAVEAARAGFDEIQFDYVRFPDIASQLRFGQPASEAARVQAIDGFLAEARRQLTAFNVYLAVDVFGYVFWNNNDTGIGQQLEDIINIVDYVSPMLYPSCFQCGIPGYSNPVTHPYEIVRLTMENAQRRLKVPPTRFRPWIQAFRDYAFDHRMFGANEVGAEIRATKDFGSDGWMLWNPQNNYAGAGLTPFASDQQEHGLQPKQTRKDTVAP
jgi:hypothetical protein